MHVITTPEYVPIESLVSGSGDVGTELSFPRALNVKGIGRCSDEDGASPTPASSTSTERPLQISTPFGTSLCLSKRPADIRTRQEAAPEKGYSDSGRRGQVMGGFRMTRVECSGESSEVQGNDIMPLTDS